MLTVAYQGVEGSFSHQVCENNYASINGNCHIGYATFVEAINAVENGQSDLAIIPVENSTAGRVMEVYQILPSSQLAIVAEHLLPIHHCLCVPTKALTGNADAFSKIKQVISHPQAIAQCRQYLAANLPHAKYLETWDTAGAARDIATNADLSIASISPFNASLVFNVTVLAKNIEDIKQNTTRFLVFAKQQLTATQLGDKPCLTTLLFETEHKSGALVKVLQVFEKHRLNITKLETYMVGHEKPNPSFYIDVASNLYGQAMQDTLDDIRNFTTGIKILGCYAASANRRGNSPFLSVASS